MTAPVPPELELVLDGWSPRGRALFAELMEDAGSELQQELVQRAVLAGHTPGEVHAFADELRALSDDECFEACTLDDDAPEGYSVSQLLRAEADPLYAFELKGGALSPNEDDDAPAPAPAGRAPVAVDAPEDRALAADPVRRAREQKRGFDVESGSMRAVAPSRPASLAAAPPPSGAMPVPAGVTGAKMLEDLLTEATKAFKVTWREIELDVAGGLPLDEALPQAVAALQRGMPVPCVIGNAHAKPLRYVLLLQHQVSGSSRAFQLYEPFSQELVWANEKDLLTRGELPFANKALRRLVRMALPGARAL